MIFRAKNFLSRLWHSQRTSRLDHTKVNILDCGNQKSSFKNQVWLQDEMRKWEGRLPLVSCLMVTKNRPNLAKCAFQSFLNQSYPHKELVIVDDGEDKELGLSVKNGKDSRIRHISLPPQTKTLGGLRNMAVEFANGDLVCQWDDDDLSDPIRLEMQVAAILAFETQACLLKQELMWWPHQNRMAISAERIWEGSCMARKNQLPTYQDIPRGEDTPVVETLVESSRVVILDNPFLYLYVVHGENTFHSRHFDLHWIKATETFEHAKYESLLEKLSLRMPITSYLEALKV